MQQYILIILGAFFLSLITGFLLIPEILNYCKEKNLYDIPNRRKVHKNPIPRLGGIAFLPSMLLAFIIAMTVMGVENPESRISINLWSVGFLTSLLLIYATGIVDDIIGLNARVKFTVQIITACVLPLCGLYINNLYGLLGIHELPYWAGVLLTICVIVLIDNSINLIDGIDGLSASLSIIALGGFFYCFWREGMEVYCILIAGLIGILIPYLYYNIWGNAEQNRKIFMGDSGSLTLGFILGFLFVKYSMDNPMVMKFSHDRIMLAYSLLIVPVFDVFRIVIYRLRHRKPLFDADKNHIHHKLMKARLTQHQALLAIIGLAVFFIILNSLIFESTGFTWLFAIDIAVFAIFHMVLAQCIHEA
ncbi:MraY family glycosyltransferase [Prevotella sp. KH2C16]|uniref:MraY family glycosyltransferase n=1 Tax=Prevotella sp. KH2C16 TaxID=1855325 RepID=UPI0008DFB0DD|nr:MraY family glycosyltransferase [Prevotella sp. KH2C16]SFG62073.1 UDP-N-acetylmuramyl pentapeptide phosphotransferase/UDP-N-acetylglucosamine-1-phosphate transferase [Prevotella sp. KH2C16]